MAIDQVRGAIKINLPPRHRDDVISYNPMESDKTHSVRSLSNQPSVIAYFSRHYFLDLSASTYGTSLHVLRKTFWNFVYVTTKTTINIVLVKLKIENQYKNAHKSYSTLYLLSL